MTLTNEATLEQFKATEFYASTKKYMLETPINGKLLMPQTVDEVLEGAYGRMYYNDNLEGLR